MKNLIGLLILILLAAGAYFIYQYQQGNYRGEREVLKDFAVEDTAAIDQVFMSQPNGKKVLISRRGHDQWLVNNSFPARKDAIELILKTAHDIKIQGSVSNKTFEDVVKRLASGSTKVEFYQKDDDKPVKTWYIGGATAGRTGTYMLLEKDGEKSAKPYITHLIMERGYLGTRFFLDPILWKERIVMKSAPQNIKSISVKHNVDSISSFNITKNDTLFTITNLKNNQSKKIPHEIAIPYFKQFSTVYYEYIDLKTPSEQLDSIYSSPYRQMVEIEMENGEQITLRTHYLPVKEGSYINNKEIYYHPERMYVYSSYMGEDVHPIVQNLTFDPLVPSFEQLVSSTNVEK